MAGVIGAFKGEYHFLSAHYLRPIIFMGYKFRSLEHFFQAGKCTRQTDFLRILNADSPGRAKKLGREVALVSNWEDIKLSVMETGLVIKFTESDLMEKLFATEGKFLIEGNTHHDNIWGDCVCNKCSNTLGLNHLGVLTMIVRKNLLAQGEF